MLAPVFGVIRAGFMLHYFSKCGAHIRELFQNGCGASSRWADTDFVSLAIAEADKVFCRPLWRSMGRLVNLVGGY